MKYRLTPIGRIAVISFCLTLIFIILGVAVNLGNLQNEKYSTGNEDLTEADQQPQNNSKSENKSEDKDISGQAPDTNAQADKQPVLVEVTNSKKLISNIHLRIYFGANVSVLEEHNYEALDLFAETALALEGAPIQIEGNCSTMSAYKIDADNENMNYELSLSRAKVIADYFQSKGIDPNRILIIGNGSSNPIVDNSTPENRKLNRRVDIFFRSIEE